MADDELILPIDKAFWPRGVMRGLTPLLRNLGDQHGNLVIAAVPNKHIMVKGPNDRIEQVKAPLRTLLEEHFPEWDIPEELGGSAAADEDDAAWEEEPTPPAPPAPAQKPKVAPAPVPEKKGVLSGLFGSAPTAPAPAKAASVGAPAKSVSGRRYPRPAAVVAPDLIWQCVRKNSSFLRKPMKGVKRSFSAEPCNLLGIHSMKFSGLVASEALDVRPVKHGIKESIHLLQSHSKVSRQSRPDARTIVTGLSKCPKKGLARLDCEIDAKFYRRDMHDFAKAKYEKVQQSFKTKKRIVKSRRSKN